MKGVYCAFWAPRDVGLNSALRGRVPVGYARTRWDGTWDMGTSGMRDAAASSPAGFYKADRLKQWRVPLNA